ncbi:tetratricopeptide repeat protein [Candidatus Chrysopegis kryptomonas]|uniref:Tetratricopeptide repeat n=1 Tax=Candidatus Chryseopegocella kryptomonas TaxID=1633643 RepID=A0A0N7MXW7_9BACT|nr:tetratricopeptide repeat protein [Candidatus Chrysopegis kryptomonas]CUT02595.1 Tetratricopeptide repeat [Candidatus Chrysopegis kryptomonas]
MKDQKNEVEAFLVELYKFEHDLPYDPMEIEKRFVNMINSFIDKNIGDRPVYLGIEIEPEFGAKYVRVPEGFMFRLYSDLEYKNYDYVPIDVSKRCFDDYSENLVNLIVKMIVNRGIYEFKFGKIEKAKFYFEEALKINPESVEVKLWLERLKGVK